MNTRHGYDWEAMAKIYAYLNDKTLSETDYSYGYVFGEFVSKISQQWLAFLEPTEYMMPM